MKKLCACLLVSLVLLGTAGCVSKGTYKETLEENKALQSQVDSLESEVSSLESQVSAVEQKNEDLLSPATAYSKAELNGVSFYYPASWEAENSEDGSSVSFSGSLSAAVFSVTPIDNSSGSLDLDDVANQYSMFSSYSQEMPDYEYGSTEVISSLGYPGAKHTFTTTMDDVEFEGTVYTVVTENKMISFQFYIPTIVSSSEALDETQRFHDVWNSVNIQ